MKDDKLTPGLEVLDEVVPPDVAAGTVDVGVGTPLVNGTPAVPDEAPEKAGATEVADGSGVAVELSEFKTLCAVSFSS